MKKETPSVQSSLARLIISCAVFLFLPLRQMWAMFRYLFLTGRFNSRRVQVVWETTPQYVLLLGLCLILIIIALKNLFNIIRAVSGTQDGYGKSGSRTGNASSKAQTARDVDDDYTRSLQSLLRSGVMTREEYDRLMKKR